MINDISYGTMIQMMGGHAPPTSSSSSSSSKARDAYFLTFCKRVRDQFGEDAEMGMWLIGRGPDVFSDWARDYSSRVTQERYRNLDQQPQRV